MDLSIMFQGVAFVTVALLGIIWQILELQKNRAANFITKIHATHQQESIPVNSTATSGDAENQSSRSVCKSSFMHIHNRLYVALFDEKQADIIAKSALQTSYRIISSSITGTGEVSEQANDESIERRFLPPNLEDVFFFDQAASAIERKDPKLKLVFQTGTHLTTQMRLTYLLGCHMILSHGVGFEEAYLAFRPLHYLVDLDAGDASISIRSCWRAMCCAKVHGWIDYSSQTDFMCHRIRYLPRIEYVSPKVP
jgi:hypothetical protein